MTPSSQHQVEIQRNLQAWASKPLLREIYARLYARIIGLIDRELPGRIVEIGAGIGNLKQHLPDSVSTDIFPNPWLDMVCDAYAMPFPDRSISHLILFDVFHHLQRPKAFLNEARRVLASNGRLILCEPYISFFSYPVYVALHHEPVAWHQQIAPDPLPPLGTEYYAAQGNATRLLFRKELPFLLEGWSCFHAEAFSCWHYLFSGGYSKPALYPRRFLPILERLDRALSRWPRVFGGRCLIGLSPAE